MKLFFLDRLTPLLALGCAFAVFFAAALDLPQEAQAAPAAATPSAH